LHRGEGSKDSLCTLHTTKQQTKGEQEKTSGIGEGHTAKLSVVLQWHHMMLAAMGMAGAGIHNPNLTKLVLSSEQREKGEKTKGGRREQKKKAEARVQIVTI